jgi:predicted Zn-dependent protease
MRWAPACPRPPPRRGSNFEFFALRDATLNAFALPGGYIGVHSGLILAAQSESELAGVLSHEIAHVTQKHLARLMGKQNQAQMTQWLAMAVAILAARSNPDVSQAAMATGAAAGVQTMLNYSRDFEREADRIGIQTLERAGFDVRGMASFFERMQKFGRLYENNAPGYLRTHPLTVERISDMENRILQAQLPPGGGLDRLPAGARQAARRPGRPARCRHRLRSQLRERKYLSEAAARYGLAVAQMRARRIPRRGARGGRTAPPEDVLADGRYPGHRRAEGAGRSGRGAENVSRGAHAAIPATRRCCTARSMRCWRTASRRRR